MDVGFKTRIKTGGSYRYLNSYFMAKAYISDAELSLEEAQNMLDKKYFHRVARRSQECVELSIKRILRLFGIEYPKTPEASKALERIKFQVKMPKWLNEIWTY